MKTGRNTKPTEEIRSLNFISSKEILETKKEKGYVIKDMMPLNSVNQFVAPTAGLKSIIATHLAIAVSNGKPFLGFKTKKMKVLYLDKENPRQTIAQRLNQMRTGLKIKRKQFPLFFLLKEGELINKEFVNNLKYHIEQEGIGLVIFDTLMRFNSEGDENNAKDINKVYASFLEIMGDTKCSILFLHHTSKDNLRYRGSSDIMGLCDTMFQIKRSSKKNGVYEDAKFTIENTKNRLGEINPINGEILFGEETIIFKVNDKFVEEVKSKINKTFLARAVICDFAKIICPTSNHEITRPEILAMIDNWNAKNISFAKDKKIVSRQIAAALQYLKLQKIFIDGQKAGVYRLNYEEKEQISKIISYIGEGNSVKE